MLFLVNHLWLQNVWVNFSVKKVFEKYSEKVQQLICSENVNFAAELTHRVLFFRIYILSCLDIEVKSAFLYKKKWKQGNYQRHHSE